MKRPVFWTAVIALVVVAALLRLTGYNFSLPYLEHIDEPAYTLAAQTAIDTGSMRVFQMEGYPPGIITLNFLMLKVFHDGTTPPGTIMPIIRLWSIAASLACIVVVALLARETANDLAGVFAAAIWALSPTVVDFGRYATADNFVALFILLALWLTLIGTRRNQSVPLNLALVSIMLATIFKYQAVFVLPLMIGVPLLRLTQSGLSRRRVISDFVWHSIALGVFFFWLAFIYEAGKAASIPYWAAPTDQLGLPPVARIFDSLRIVVESVAHPLLWLGALIGGAFWRLDPHRVRVVPALTILVAALFYVVGVNLFGDQNFRQLVAFGALCAALLGVGLAGWVVILERLTWLKGSTTRQTTIVTLLFIGIMIPLTVQSIERARVHTLHDRRNDLAVYMDTSLPPAAHIATLDNHKTLNRSWGGYAGIHEFPFQEMERLDARPLDEWRDRGVEYAIMSNGDYQALDPGARTETMLLKQYPPSADYRGPDMVVVCLCTPSQLFEAVLGTIVWRGYDTAVTDDALTIRHYWQANAPLDGEYRVFNHLLDQAGTLVAQADGSPLFDVRRTTDTWDDPTEIMISATFTLPLTDLDAGEYDVHVGFYRVDTGVRLTDADGRDSVRVTTITVGE